MGKTAIKKLDLREGEARLWKDDNDGSLTVSVDDPWDGFKNPAELERLGKFLLAAVQQMRRKVTQKAGGKDD